jgi:hypothetical protein
MSKEAINEIEEIKAQLYRQKWFIRLSVLGWIGGAAAFLLGAADMNPMNLRVKRLALVDSKGVERLILAADNKQLMFKGKPWDRRSAVSGIILQNANGDEVGGMATSEDGLAAIVLDSYSDYTKWGGADRIALFSAPDGTAGMVLNDLKQKSRARIVSGPAMDVGFSLLNQDEQSEIHGTVNADGTSVWSDGGP